MEKESKNRQTIEEASANRRAEVVKPYLTEPDVLARLGIDRDHLTDLRERRNILAVWHAPVEAWLYPDFQFDPAGLIKEMPEILETFDLYYSHCWENTWSILEWFLAAHSLLDRRRPMDVIQSNPSVVLEIAGLDLWEDPETLW
ncbi:hypothetical protein [Solilutibacter silvestris]|uniref:hypothetical protein n=1 Tax=Solilutibacter silvestris TaxID=1645665 RepID=UPI003D335978